MKRRFSSREMARRRKLRQKKLMFNQPSKLRIGFIQHMVIKYGIDKNHVRIFYVLSKKDKKVTELLCKHTAWHGFPEDLTKLVQMVRLAKEQPGVFNGLLSVSAVSLASAIRASEKLV